MDDTTTDPTDQNDGIEAEIDQLDEIAGDDPTGHAGRALDDSDPHDVDDDT